MGITLSNRGRVAIKQQSAWGTAETTFAATTYLEVESPMIPQLSREALRTDTYRPANTEPEIVAGSKAPTELSFRFKMHGWSSATPSADPTVFPDALLLECILGDASGDGYTTAIAAGGTTSLVNVTDGLADTAWQGYAQLYPTATGKTIGWVNAVATGVSPDTVTPIQGLSAAPAAGTAYGSWVAWLSNSDQLPLTFDWLGSDASSHIRYHDGLPTSVKIVFAAKQLVAVDVTMRFLDWENLGTGGAPADYAYGFPLIPASIGANGTYAVVDGGEFCFATTTIDIAQTLTDVECVSSTQGVSQMKWTDRRVTCEVVSTTTDISSGLTTYTPGAVQGAFQVNAATASAGRSLSVLIPAPVLLEQPTLQDLGGKLATRLLYGCGTYSGDTGSTAPADTPFRIAWL